MTVSVNWSYPTSIRFGAGRIAEIDQACAAAGITNPLLITDRVLADLPMVELALGHLDAAGLGRAIFSEVDSNPTEVSLLAGLSAYHAGDHDGVV
ncbi:MAG: iron-containing alcohol dehydrogenase, partial [Gammaproteobacteria bacterium]|nr:iron-containing alcohol dehydrogenase [Gammaproteobacteria bacterium]